MAPRPEYVCGLDLGQTSDPTALAVLERLSGVYSVRHLERYPLGTPYTGRGGEPGIVERVLALTARPPLPGCILIIDQTGVGRPVVDSFRALPMIKAVAMPVTITSGHNANYDNDLHEWHVPKKDLVGTMQMLLQSGRLLIADSLPLAATLEAELRNFKVKITAAANETFGAWRDGDHDDLVLAVALAAWWSEKHMPFSEAKPAASPRQHVPPEVFGRQPGRPAHKASTHGRIKGPRIPPEVFG